MEGHSTSSNLIIRSEPHGVINLNQLLKSFSCVGQIVANKLQTKHPFKEKRGKKKEEKT